MSNEFTDDALFFLRKTACYIRVNPKPDELLYAVLFFALGMERLLKGILFDLNPTYVYKNPDFKNTAPLLYGSKLLPSVVQNKEIASTPDGDVLTFKLSLLRAKAISETTDKHTSLLYSLSNYRDILVHHKLSQLDSCKLSKLILADFYPLIQDYCKELAIRPDNVFGPNEIKIADISSKNQDSPEDRIKMKIDVHLKRWEQLRNVDGYIVKAQFKNNIIKAIRKRDLFFKVTECPACKNDALMQIEVDFETFDDRSVPVGAFVSSLECLFCKFLIDDYDEIDYLKLQELLVPEDIEQNFT